MLALLNEPKTVSRLWDEVSRVNPSAASHAASGVNYDWFVLSLDLLFLLGAVDLAEGRLHRRQR
jgi:hypothetical protein